MAQRPKTVGKFVDLAGSAPKHRYTASGSVAISEEDVKEPERLQAILVALSKRITALETNQPPESIEFEKDVTAAGNGNVTLNHYFNSPVRFIVTHWKGSATHSFNVNQSLTTDNSLVLNSLVAGRVCIRVEKSQHNITKS